LSPLRLLILVRRFWPQVGSAARAAGLLGPGLVERGCQVTVLTARWWPRGPASFSYGGARVVRLAPPPEGSWGTWRYTRAIRRWLAQHQGDYDLVYVFGLKDEAQAALRAAGERLPVVLRPERSGPAGDCFWQIDSSGGRRIKAECMKAAALVGATRLLEAELQAAGYPRPQIHYVPVGVPIPPARGSGTKADARQVLAKSHKPLELPRWAPLLLYAGRLAPGRGLEPLLEAFSGTAARWPNARLWLLGAGPMRPTIRQRAELLGIAGRVLTPGVFDEIDGPLAAADLFVQPTPEDGTPLALVEAMAAGLPIVATDVPGHRTLLTHDENALLVPPANAVALGAAIGRLLRESGLGARLGAAARRRAETGFSLANSVEQHLTLFQQLVGKAAQCQS
jgi:glycosyltransferase involved in cell wall biosynthesis